MAGPSSTAYLLTENLLLQGTVSSSATAAGSNALNALDYRTTSYWRPAAPGACWIESTFAAPVIIDSVGLYRHNCASAGASAQVQYHDGSDWVTVQTLSSLTDNQCVLRRWAGVAATRWRVLFNTTAALVLGVLVLGRAVRLPYGMPAGFVPPRFGRQTDLLSNKTEAGQFAGRAVIQRGALTEIQQPRVPVDWMRSTGEQVLLHAEQRPFFFSWADVAYPADCVYCQVRGEIPAARVIERGWMSFSLPVECLL